MASISFVNNNSSGTASGTSLSVSVPSGVSDGDLLLAIITISVAKTFTLPSGWTQEPYDYEPGTGDKHYLFSKIASSESGSYQWSWTTAARGFLVVGAWTGDINTSSFYDEISNTTYTTSDTILRAGGVTAGETDQAIIFVGGSFRTTPITFTAPTNPDTFTEDADVYSANADTGVLLAHLNWTGSGATGNIDATISASGLVKHAWAILLKKPPTEDTPPSIQASLSLQVVLESLETSDTPSTIQGTQHTMLPPLGEVTPSSFTGRVRGFRLFENHALEQRDHNHYES